MITDTETLTPSPRFTPQRRLALAVANETRSDRARIKRELKGGTRSFHELLENPPATVRTALVAEMMLAMAGWGRSRVYTVLNRAGISPRRTIMGLTLRQRMALHAAIPTPTPTRDEQEDTRQ